MKLRLQAFCAAGLAALFSWAAFAQDDVPESTGTDLPPAAAPAAPSAVGDNTILPTPKGGDKVYMKSGTVMSGVQVIRSNPANYEVQLIAGEPPMLIPRRQVERVEYDDIDPLREQMREKMFPKPKEVTMASGERVTSELRDKLEAPISAEPIVYTDLDLVAILNDIKAKTQVKLTVDPSVEERGPAQRKWTVEIAAGRTLMAFLREEMMGRFNFIEVILETDTVLVMTKDAAKKRAEAAAAAGGEAPAPAQTPIAETPATLPPPR